VVTVFTMAFLTVANPWAFIDWAVLLAANAAGASA